MIVEIILTLVQMDLLHHSLISAQTTIPGPSFSQRNTADSSQLIANETVSNNTSSVSIDIPPGLIPYTNDQIGIGILYPSGWMPSVSGLSYPEVVAFYSPLQNVSDLVPAKVVISSNNYQSNVSLQEITDPVLANLFNLAQLNQSQQLSGSNQSVPLPIISILSSNPVNISGYPAHRVVYSNTVQLLDNPIVSYVMQIWTVVGDNRVYSITYDAEASKFAAHLPDVNRMLNSLIISNQTMTT